MSLPGSWIPRGPKVPMNNKSRLALCFQSTPLNQVSKTNIYRLQKLSNSQYLVCYIFCVQLKFKLPNLTWQACWNIVLFAIVTIYKLYKIYIFFCWVFRSCYSVFLKKIGSPATLSIQIWSILEKDRRWLISKYGWLGCLAACMYLPF